MQRTKVAKGFLYAANILTDTIVIVQYICAMNILRIAFELFLLYLLYKFIFEFLVPVVKTTKQVKQKVNEMNSRMQEQMRQQSQQHNAYSPKPEASEKKTKSGEYIDFEEVK